MHLRKQLSAIRSQFGQPYHVWMTQEFNDQGWNLVKKSTAQGRAHDVTLFIRDRAGRFALMSKHSYPPGVFRSPSGGVNPGEDFIQGALREAKEETGLQVSLNSFVLHITLDITRGGDVTRWESYILLADTEDTELNPTDHKEVREALWAGRTQLESMNDKLRATETGGLIYRARLTEAFLWAMDNPLTIREARERDHYRIDDSLNQTHYQGVDMKNCMWFLAEVNGLWAGTIGLIPHPDCMELGGLTVAPMFRGRGIGHALAEYAADRWMGYDFRKFFSAAKGTAFPHDLWIITETPGYFLPVGFSIGKKSEAPASLLPALKPSPIYVPTGMKLSLA